MFVSFLRHQGLTGGGVALFCLSCSYTVGEFPNGSAPSSLTYAQNPAIYHRGVAIAPNIATTTGGTPAHYSVTPNLPAGLALDATAGTLSGNPAAATPQQSFVITASNAIGQTQTTLDVTVTDTPPSLVFPNQPYTFIVGRSNVAALPINTGGPFTSCAPTTALPLGVVVSDASTCVLGGTPSMPTGLATYTLTVTYDGGSVDASVALQVANPLSLFPPTVTLRALPTEPFQFNARGGVPPYAYTVIGPGQIDATGLFVPPIARSTATVQVTDAVGEVALSTATSVVTLVNGPADAFAFSDSTFYIGGTFSFANPFPSPSLVAADLATGAPEPAFDTQQSFDGPVTGLASDGTSVYAVGSFTTYRGTAARGLLKLDAASGAPDSGFLTGAGFDAPPLFVGQDSGAVYFAGAFNDYDGTAVSGIAKLDKDLGTLLPGFTSPSPGLMGGFAVDGAQLFVSYSSGPSFFVERVDATTGQTLSYPDLSSSFTPITALTVAPDGLFVIEQDTVMKLDKTTGKNVAGFTPPSFTNTPTALGFDGTSLWVAGPSNFIGSTPIGHLAKLNAATGELLASVNGNDPLSDPTNTMQIAFANGLVYVGGDFAASNGLAAFSAQDLSPVTAFADAGVFTGQSASNVIAALVTTASALFIGGNFEGYGGVAANNVAAFDRATFAANQNFAAAGGTDDQVRALAIGDATADPNALYIGGDFFHYGAECWPALVKVDATSGARITAFATSGGATCTAHNTNVYSISSTDDATPAIAVGGFITELQTNAGLDATPDNLVILATSDGHVLQQGFSGAIGEAVSAVVNHAFCLYYLTAANQLCEDHYDTGGCPASSAAAGHTAITTPASTLAEGAGFVYAASGQDSGIMSVSGYSEGALNNAPQLILSAYGNGISSLAYFIGDNLAIGGALSSYFQNGLFNPAGNLLFAVGSGLAASPVIWSGNINAGDSSIEVVAPMAGLLFIGGNFTHYRGERLFYAGFVDPLDGSLVR